MNRTSQLEELVSVSAHDEPDFMRAWRTVFPSQRVRKEPRFTFCFQIQVRGLDSEMGMFLEHTNTADISKSGCRFTLQTPVERGSLIDIAVLGEDGRLLPDRALYSVVWCRAAGNVYEVGVKLVDGPNLWNIQFPDCGTGSW